MADKKRKSGGNDPDSSLDLRPPSSSKVPRKSTSKSAKGNVEESQQNGDVNQQNGDVEEREIEEFERLSDNEDGEMFFGDIYIPPAPKPALTMDAKGPRLLITYIENINFKSYYGKQMLGPFHKSFTSIIGPNGSGKSNVIDSMLFVFGYRASKIRSKKISVLIHKSSQHLDVSSATVSVHFEQIIDREGSDDYDVVPNSGIIVSRTCFRDNSSFYTLNGKRVQFKEVAKLLKSHGIDLDHNRFLILQGEVELIAMMKSKGQNENETGLLEYLEDIIGTSRFKEPLQKMVSRVEEYTELRKEKLNRVRLVENEKNKLEQPMKSAMTTLSHVNNLTKLRHMLLQKYIYETNRVINGKVEEVNKLKAELKEIDDKLKETQKQREEKQNFLKAHNQKYEKLKERKEKLIERNKSLRNRDAAIHAETNQANKRKKNVHNLLQTEKGKQIELIQVPEKNRKEILECEELEKKLKVQKEELEQKLQAVMEIVRAETEGLQDAKDKLQAKLIELKKSEEEANMKVKLAESELKILMRNELEDKAKFEKLTESLSNSTKALSEKKAMLTELSSSLPAMERELTATQRQLDSVREEENKTAVTAQRLRVQLEESRQTITANYSKNRVLDFIMAQRKSGKVPGVFGRLGDLGGIDMKYDVAISTSCGSLDNILVDTVDTAKTCIELLKQHNIGRATFIALEKQEHLISQADRKINTPENVPRLFDLIKVTDPRVRPAFYYALRDTIVAKDLEQATRIAYGRVRYRVVSLNGDLIEIAGTMSGGGKSVMRGRMGTSVRQSTSETTDPSILAAQERKVEELEARLQELRSSSLSLEDKLTILNRKVNDMRMETSKLEIEVKHLSEQVPTLRSQLKEQETKMKKSGVDLKQKAKLEQAISSATQLFDKAKSASEKVETEVKEIQAQIVAKSGGKLQSIQKSINDVTKQMEKIRTEVTKLNVAINASARNMKKCEEKMGHMETDIAEIEAKLKKLQDEKKSLTIEAAKIEKELEEIDESLSEDGDQFSGVKEEIAKLQKAEAKLKSERVDMVNNVGKMEKTVSDHKSKMPVYKKELSSLKLEIPEIDGIPVPTPLTEATEEELAGSSVENLREKCKDLQDLIGDDRPNMNAILEFRAKEVLYLKRCEELESITNQRNQVRDIHDNLRRKRAMEFMQGFSTITAKLKEMYQMITLGGDAELELVDSLDPFTEGIVFSVRPPNKSWKNISNLSGGEKTLSSLALVFALHYYKPSPLYVMDEIDAALDFKNVSIVANYIKERTRNAQFIIISLRYNMFEIANRLVGIYKTRDCTKSVTIKNAVQTKKDLKETREEPASEERENGEFDRLLAMTNGDDGIVAPAIAV